MKINTFNEYNYDLNKIYNLVPWGGLITSNVLRNKDNSLMGFIAYEENINIKEIIDKKSQFTEFSSGWGMWINYINFEGTVKTFLTLYWYPKLINKKLSNKNNVKVVKNTIGNKEISFDNTIEYFETVLKTLNEELSLYLATKILKNEEILSVLATSIQDKYTYLPMIYPPIALDAIITKNVDFATFPVESERKNDLEINGKNIVVVTTNGFLTDFEDYALNRAFKNLNYRFTRRILFYSKKDYDNELNKYTSKWCQGRNIMKKFLLNQLPKDKKFQAQITNTFIFYIDFENKDKFLSYIDEIFDILKYPYVVEEYNKKQVFWASISGLAYANKNNMIKEFDSIGDLLPLSAL